MSQIHNASSTEPGLGIRLAPPLGLHEQGQRESNQDSIYPSLEAARSGRAGRLFMVCDGVGGAVRGEVASRMVCEAFAQYFHGREQAAEEDIRQALQAAEWAMDSFVQEDADAKGMATTLALLFVNQHDATIAHVGDSRVYQIRNGEVIFKTEDHSLVNELIATKVITASEAVRHPGRNVISRAVMGRHKPAVADVNYRTDVLPGDYFFLCSDGVLESITDEALAALLGHPDLTDEDKLESIRSICQVKARDNYSAWLLAVESTPAAPSREEASVKDYTANNNRLWEQVVSTLGKLMFPKRAEYRSATAGIARLGIYCLEHQHVGNDREKQRSFFCVDIDANLVKKLSSWT